MSDKNGVIEITLSEMIAIHRDRLKMSQADLAKTAGVSRNYISQIERGKIENVSYKVLSNICSVLGLAMKIEYKESQQNHTGGAA